MRITRIDIDGFGALREFQVGLNPRINLFTGENEAGKSTIQQAVFALLYGFYQRGRIVQTERVEHERFRPWSGGPYGGCIEYALDSGRCFRVRRSFETDDIPTSVIDLTTGRDLAAELGFGRHGNVPVGTAHLGMRRDVFLSTCFFSQASIARIEAPEAVSETIASMVDTGTADSSVSQAVRLLEEAISKVGGSRTGSKPLPAARSRLQRTRTELEALDKDYLKLETCAAEKEDCEERLRRLREEEHLNNYWMVSRRLQAIHEKASRLQAIDSSLAELERQAEDLSGLASFPRELRDTVLEARSRLETLGEQHWRLEREWEGVSSQAEALRAEVHDCRREIETMEYARDFPVEREEEFRRLRFSLDESLERLDSARREEEEALRLQKLQGDRGALRKAGFISVLALGAILGIWLALSGNSAAGLALSAFAALAGIGVFLLYRPVSKHELRTAGLRNVLQSEELRAAGLEKQLSGLLLEVGIRADSIASGQEAFLRRFTACKDLATRQADLAAKEQTLQRLLSKKEQLADTVAQLGEAERTLRQTLRRAGIEDPVLAEAIRLFEDRYEKRCALDAVQDRVQAVQEQRTALLGGGSETMLGSELQRLRAQLEEALVRAPGVAALTADLSAQELESEVSRLKQEITEAQQTKIRLETVIQTLLSKHRPRVEIEEEIAYLEAEVSRLSRFADALALARDRLREAGEEVHRDFAPRLGHSLSEGLKRITRGRYLSAFVDPKDFSIRLQTPDAGRVVDVRQVSTGTREMAYLLLRIELARMLSSSREALPLIMDDPFVNLDHRRFNKVMELISEISEENQVLLFTKDASVTRWLASNCADASVFAANELPGPIA